MISVSKRRQLIDLFQKGVDSCLPEICLPPHLPTSPSPGETYVLAAGKAAAAMARAAEAHLPYAVKGLAVTRYGYAGHSVDSSIRILEAGHPVPDENSVRGAQQLLELAAKASSKDRVLFLISGGGSALLMAPIKGLGVEQKQEITRHLLLSGAPISDINFIRRHLSQIKGGGLAAAAARAECFTYIISDVVGDDPSAIASGPTVASPRDPQHALALLEHYGWSVSEELATAVRSAAGKETPSHKVTIVASGQRALAAIEAELRDQGYPVTNLGAEVEGDAAETGVAHAAIARQLLGRGRHAIISGGELTVRVKNPAGRGGPNLEYLAGLMTALPESGAITAIACDSDGIDGTEDNAGGVVSGLSLARAAASGLCLHDILDTNRTYHLFDTLGDLVKTGPTGTNVNDLRIILLDPK